MNERNVAAIERVLNKVVAELDPKVTWTLDIVSLAERLAAHGVLVPSALTDDGATASPSAEFPDANGNVYVGAAAREMLLFRALAPEGVETANRVLRRLTALRSAAGKAIGA